MENRSRCRSGSGGGRSTIFDTVGADRGGRNPLHYNGASSPLGVKSDVFIDIGLQTSSYCRGNIHIWKTDRAAARDLGGVGAPSSILLEQIGGVAIRCTIMVLRRLWASKVTCLSTSASRLRHIVVVIYIYGKPIALPPGIWRGSEHHLRYCWSRSGGSEETSNGSIKHVTFAT